MAIGSLARDRDRCSRPSSGTEYRARGAPGGAMPNSRGPHAPPGADARHSSYRAARGPAAGVERTTNRVTGAGPPARSERLVRPPPASAFTERHARLVKTPLDGGGRPALSVRRAREPISGVETDAGTRGRAPAVRRMSGVSRLAAHAARGCSGMAPARRAARAVSGGAGAREAAPGRARERSIAIQATPTAPPALLRRRARRMLRLLVGYEGAMLHVASPPHGGAACEAGPA